MTKCFSAETDQRSGFTLIELLAVITIILILAGLILGIAGSAQTKAAQSRAQTEIQAFSTAAGNYQTDNGTYPRVSYATSSTANTDKLFPCGANANLDPAGAGTGGGPTYSVTSQILFQLLSGYYFFDSTNNNKLTVYTGQAGIAKPTTYFTFKDNQLNYGSGNTTDHSPGAVQAILDPWGFSYGYSTAYQYDMDQINAGQSTATSPTDGYNPTFDLWSTSGYSNSGKATPANTTASTIQSLWVKNW